MGLRLFNAALVAFLVVGACCAGQKRLEEAMDNTMFFKLDLPSYSRSKCSPDVPDGFTGILLRAPAEVSLSAGGELPLCGAYRLSSAFIRRLGKDVIESTVITFVDKQAGEPFSFNLKPDKQPVAEKQPPAVSAGADDPDIEVVDDYPVLLYFNVDVLTFFPELPRNNRTYLVYATLDQFKSESIEIKVAE